MSRKWHDIIAVYGYEIHVPGDIDSTDYITMLKNIHTNSDTFLFYTMVTCIHNGWHENQMEADDVFPIIGFEVSDVMECVTLLHELDQYLMDNSIFEGISCVEKPRLFSGIHIDTIQPPKY